MNDQTSTTATRCPANKWYLFNLHVKEDKDADLFPMGEVRECHIEGGEIHFVTDRGTFVFFAHPLDEHPTHFLDEKGKEAILFPPSSV